MTRKKFRIKYKKLLLFLLMFLVFILFIVYLFNLRITNIYVDGNYYLSEQQIIEIGELQDYPKTFLLFSNRIESKLTSNAFISKAVVKKKGLTKVYISIQENKPLFYDEISGKTVLTDGSLVDKKFNLPSLVNTIDVNFYQKFIEKFSVIDIDVLNVISEVEYVPSQVDHELFLFTMNDGNYIYVNLNKFNTVNQYFNMIVNFNNHKGILYLDSGEYFKILDN